MHLNHVDLETSKITIRPWYGTVRLCLHCTGFAWSGYQIFCIRKDLAHKVIIIGQNVRKTLNMKGC